MTAEKPREKGKKTAITWMIAATIVVGLVAWRVVGSESPAPETAQVAVTETPPPAQPPAPAPPPALPPAPPAEPPPPSQRSKFTTGGGGPTATSLPGAWVDVPASSGAAAVTVLALHGRGDTAENFQHIARSFPPELAWRFLEGPLAYGDGRRWFDSEVVASRSTVPREEIQALREHVASLPQPVVLLGFSQGCMMILHSIAAGIEGVGAVACIGGWVIGEPEFVDHERPPILFVNGTADTIAKPAAVRAAMQRYENNGFPTEQIEFAGGHVVPTAEAQTIGEWLIRTAHGG